MSKPECTVLTLEQMAQAMQECQSLILVSHQSPDGDTLGSCLALAAGLEQLGKKVQLLVDDAISSKYSFMPGVEKYAFPTATSSYEADALVIVDVSSLDRIGLVSSCVKAKQILNIDHHITNTHYADKLYLDAKAAACGEIIYDLLRLLPVELTQDIASNLYVALATDCGFFKYSNTTPQTMRIAAELLQTGIKPHEIAEALEMHSRETLELMLKALNTLEFLEEGKIGLIMLPLGVYNKDLETDSFMQYPRYTEGVDVAILLKAVEAEVTRVSMRSRQLDVSKVALSFGGGGHQRAAGCTINKNIQAAKQDLLAAVIKEMSLAHE